MSATRFARLSGYRHHAAVCDGRVDQRRGFGLVPSLLTAVTSGLALDFFFLPPLYRWSIADPEDILSLIFFSIVVAFTSGLASRLRNQMLLARNRAKTTADLYTFSRKLAGTLQPWRFNIGDSLPSGVDA